MGEEKIVEEWFLISSIDGGYNRFPFRSLLGLSEHIKKEKDENPNIKTRVIIAGGALGFLPGYITKGATDAIKALQKDILTPNDIVVATKPHLMRIVDNVDEVYYFAGIEDKKNISELYAAFLYYFSKDPRPLWENLVNILIHEVETEKIIQQTEFSGKTNKERLDKTLKEIEENKAKLNQASENEKKEIETKIENLEKKKEKYKAELSNIAKKIEINKSELEDCKIIQSLLEEILLRHYIESPKGLYDIRGELLEIFENQRARTIAYKDGVIQKLEQIVSNTITKLEEERIKKMNSQNLNELERQRDDLDKKRREIEEEIKRKEAVGMKKTNVEEKERIQKEIEKLKEQSEAIQLQLKKIAEEIKKILYSERQKYPRTSTTFEEFTGNIRGKSDVAKLLWKLSSAEYLFYLKNAFGRRENVKIILNQEENNATFDVLFQNKIQVGEKQVKVITNLSKNGRYLQNSLQLAIANIKDEDFVVFPSSAPRLKLVASQNKKGYTFVVGVPPLVDSEALEKELKLNIESKYQQPLSKRLLLPSVEVLRFYENGSIGIAILKEAFLHKLSNERIQKEIQFLKAKKIETTKENIDKIESLHIRNKLPTELSNGELKLIDESILAKYSSKINGNFNKINFYIISDTHIGAASFIDLTKPSPEELLGGVASIISKDIKNSKDSANILVILGDMIEAKDFGIVESQITELPQEFKKWLETQKVEESVKNGAILLFSYIVQKRAEKLKYGPVGNIVEPFSQILPMFNKIIVVSGNHQLSFSEGKQITEADMIYDYIINNNKVEIAKVVKAPGKNYGGIELPIKNAEEQVSNVWFIHKIKSSSLTRFPSLNVFSAHFHEFLAEFTSDGKLIQNGALALENAFTQQLAVPTSNQLRGFSKVSINYLGKEEAEVTFQPILYKEIQDNIKQEDISKEIFKQNYKQILELIQRFIDEKRSIPTTNNEFKQLIREKEQKQEKQKTM
jgi:hypothetical protein